VARETSLVATPTEMDRPLGLVTALQLNRHMSGQGTQLGVEPWYLNERLRHGWRGWHNERVVRSRAFSRLNSVGLLSDLVDFQLFVPGLTPRRVAKKNARWIPVFLAQHAVESIIGDVRPRVLRGTR
jgi:hypothetical protein